MKKWKPFLSILFSICLLIFISSCNSSVPQRLVSGKQITPHDPETDSIQPPITYTLEELGDFNGTPVTLNFVYNYLDKRYLHFIDGKMVEDQKKDKAFKQLKKKGIDSVEVIPVEEAIEIYGQKARHGAVIIRSKK